MRFYICNVIAMLFAAFAQPAAAQVSRVSIDSKHCHQENYVDVYEYDFVDVQPRFPGGDRGLVNYINSTRKYPHDAYKDKIQGRVLCSFIINTDGSVCNVSVIRGAAYPSLDKEAVRIIKEMPNWKPGKMADEDVPVHCIIPIAFRL